MKILSPIALLVLKIKKLFLRETSSVKIEPTRECRLNHLQCTINNSNLTKQVELLKIKISVLERKIQALGEP